MDIEWMAQDQDTLAHASRLTVRGRKAVAPHVAEVTSPHRATTRREEVGLLSAAGRAALVVAGEFLSKQTLDNVGRSKDFTDALASRLKAKVIPGRINVAFPRVPSGYEQNGRRVDAPRIDDLRASALVDVQLEADADLIVPPIPAGLDSHKVFLTAFERTRVGMQTFPGKREMVGFVPTTDHLEIVRDMVDRYVRAGVRFFAIDFSGASNQPSLMRTAVRTIREKLHLGSRARDKSERFYLHVFNVATSRKSSLDIAPLSDIITHPYGVDSTSGVMWGGGKLDDVAKLRYYETRDYGAYRKTVLSGHPLSCACPTCSGKTVAEIYSGTPQKVLERLRTHRIHAYGTECLGITQRISASRSMDGYEPYLKTKTEAKRDIDKILSDVREIRASL